MIFQFLLLVFLCSNIKTENVTILTKFGSVTGNRTISQNGFQYDIFSGIPFAKKAERFKKSELITSWDGILMATQNAKKCIPKTRPQNSDDFSEDCLFLNIMRPSKRNISMKMPVVVFIHGGGFAEGDANVANCNEFAKSFSSQMIVVVSIQYRLGAFGFLSLGCNSTILPCNIGIWDQKTAFEFVDKIIEDFGGDNRKMTLMGHSAGAMSVSIHSISPITSKYFNNFIELSGSYWGLLANQNSKNQKKVLEQIGCNFSNFSIIFECLSSVNLNDLYEAQKNTELYPDIGDELLPDYPFNLVKKEKTKKNLLSGLQTLELLYGSPYNGNFDYDPLVTKNELLNYINSSLSSKYGKNQHQAFSMISDHFIFKNPDFDDNDDRFYFQQRSRIDSNLAVDISVLREIQDKLPFYGSIYVYHFKHFNNNEFDKNYPIKTSYHCEEFPYLWNVFLHEKFVFNENDTKVSAFFVKSLGNFIKFGNPSTDKIDWPSTDSSFIHLEITSEPKISRNLFRDSFEFWNQIRDTLKYDIISNLSYQNISYSSFEFNYWILSIFIIRYFPF